MPPADSSVSVPGQLSCDILVVGGGIMGLWGAVKAAQAGLAVVLVDRGAIGGGASGGLMGALFPWMPDRWDDKKQFQFDALVSLPRELAPLQAATGLSAGFARRGRIIPLPKPHLRAIHERLARDAESSWRQGDSHFSWTLEDHPPVADYIAPDLSEAGFAHDTLAARASPRALTALLRAWLLLQPNVALFEQTTLASLDADGGRAEFATTNPSSGGALAPHSGPLPASGEKVADRSDEGQPQAITIRFSHAFIAAGTDSFPILERLLPPLSKPLGQGVKGQAALLKADLDPSLPVVFLDGIYVVPHEDGRVAVGSTSENSFAEPFSTDHQLDTVIEKARALIPLLRDAPVLERWAGLRPKAIGRDPLIGPLPGHENIISLTGGFKISFGMAHRLADCAVDYALGRRPLGLPANFTLAGQIAGIAGPA